MLFKVLVSISLVNQPLVLHIWLSQAESWPTNQQTEAVLVSKEVDFECYISVVVCLLCLWD